MILSSDFPDVKWCPRTAQRTREALNQYVNERVYDRLKSAMATEGDALSMKPVAVSEGSLSEESISDTEESDIVTTDEELQAFYIVKTLLHDVVDVRRIEMRDAKSFCAIYLDHTNRKPICRLWFNRTQKYLGLIDVEKNEERVPISDLDDIYQYAARLKATIGFYNSPSLSSSPDQTLEI